MTIAEVAEYLLQVQRGSVCEPTRKGKIQVRKDSRGRSPFSRNW